MGEMRTAATDMTDTCADLLPFPLLVNKVVHHATTRLATFPSSHPLKKHVSRAANRNVKRHRAPLHEVTHVYNIRPADLEDICPVRFELKWCPQCTTQGPESRPEAIEATRTAQADIKVFLDGSGIGGSIGAATVLYRNGKLKPSLRKYLGREDQHMVYEAEVVSLTLAAELIRKERNV